MEKKYNCLMFDFDRTLWDVDANQKSALQAVWQEFGLSDKIPDYEAFFEVYLRINDRMWLAYRDGKIDQLHLRNHRFVELLEKFGIADPEMVRRIANRYMDIAPTFDKTIPHAHEILEALGPRYPIHLITNGFNEVQHRKIEHCGMQGKFGRVFTSEEAGAKKPDPRMFEFALREAGVDRHETIMIGDDIEADIAGAIAVGIDTVFFNPFHVKHALNPTYEIDDLRQLKKILL